jgi:hypothetical protein
MLDYQFKRLAITQDVSLQDKQGIDGSIIKKFCSGGDYINARKNNKVEVAGILQVKGKFLMLNVDRVLVLHSIIYGKWIENSISDESFKIKIEEYIVALTLDARKIKNFIDSKNRNDNFFGFFYVFILNIF